MKLLTAFSFLFLMFLSNAKGAECHGYYSVNEKAREARVDYLELKKGVPQKFCLKIPKSAAHNIFVEFNSVNLGNASCSDLKMTVNPPGVVMDKGVSFGSQPGVVMPYKSGLWVVRLLLRDGCNKYTLGARW